MRLNRVTPSIVETLTAMGKRQVIPVSTRRAAIREKLLMAFSEISLAVFETRTTWPVALICSTWQGN